MSRIVHPFGTGKRFGGEKRWRSQEEGLFVLIGDDGRPHGRPFNRYGHATYGAGEDLGPKVGFPVKALVRITGFKERTC